MLNNLTMDSNIEGEKDQIATGGPVETGLYKGVIRLAYLEKSSKGALAFNVHVELEGGRMYREALYLTGGDAKGNKNYYETQNGDRKYLPGFLIANSMAVHTTGKTIDKLETEEKVIKLYDFDAKKELPAKRQVIMEMINQPIALGIFQIRENKGDPQNDYKPTNEERFINQINKVFDAETLATTTEKEADADPEFYKTWESKYDSLIDRFKPVEGAPAAKQGAPMPQQNAGNTTPANSEPTNSLFDNE